MVQTALHRLCNTFRCLTATNVVYIILFYSCILETFWYITISSFHIIFISLHLHILLLFTLYATNATVTTKCLRCGINKQFYVLCLWSSLQRSDSVLWYVSPACLRACYYLPLLYLLHNAVLHLSCN